MDNPDYADCRYPADISNSNCHADIWGDARDNSADYRDDGIAVLITAIGLSEWVPFARTVRATTLVEKERNMFRLHDW